MLVEIFAGPGGLPVAAAAAVVIVTEALRLLAGCFAILHPNRERRRDARRVLKDLKRSWRWITRS
ncbi:hypothetical protein [Nocardia nova]|uniref:hypothetical protein n=1 Tax=Nocardia nova TaxID=37330 RepID=UPI0011AFD7B1|nr:hypothetical protein [Nocardia nova]